MTANKVITSISELCKEFLDHRTEDRSTQTWDLEFDVETWEIPLAPLNKPKFSKVPLSVSVTCCGTTFVTSLGFLALASCHLWTDEAKIPLETNEEWLTHIIALIPVCICYMIFSVYFLWTILAKERKLFFLSTLVMNMILLGSAIYFTVIFDQELGVKDASPDDLFLKAKNDISKELDKQGAGVTFIPPWIDRIQRESTSCCGIKTYRDWQEFWPKAPNHIPASCCKDPTNTSTYCPSDLSALPFPKTPIMFIKEETGCVDEINTTAKKSIRECFIYGIIMCCVLGLAEVAYVVQYSLQYMGGNPLSDISSSRLPWGGGKDPAGGDDGNGVGELGDNLNLIGPQSSEFLDMGMGSQGTTVSPVVVKDAPAFQLHDSLNTRNWEYEPYASYARSEFTFRKKLRLTSNKSAEEEASLIHNYS